MKAVAILSLVAVAMAAIVDKRDCHADNCARQVTGTRDGLSPISERKADCSSFQKTTVVPDASTVTVTVTVDPEDDAPNSKRAALEYRAATKVPSAVPAYASSCDTPARFGSVCSCWGITATVTTAPTPTETKTVTVTQDYCEDL